MQTVLNGPDWTCFRRAPVSAPSKRSVQDSAFVAVQPRGHKTPLYLVHGVGGGMLWGYENLARCLGSDRPVFMLQCHAARGLAEPATIEEMAARYVRDLRAAQPEGPYHLGGYCFGGNVAFEMARQLQQQGAQVGAVVLMNSVPANSRYDLMPWTPVNTFKFCRNLAYWAMQLAFSPTARASELLVWKWRTLMKKLSRWFRLPAQRGRGLHVSELVDLADLPDPSHRDRWIAHLRAFCRFHPKPYAGEVILLRTRGHQMFCNFSPDYGWGEFARGGVVVRVLGGEHESLLVEPHVRPAAATLAAELQRCEHPPRHPLRTWEHAQWLPQSCDPVAEVGFAQV